MQKKIIYIYICIYIYMTFHLHDVALWFLQHVHSDGVCTYLSPVQSGGVKLLGHPAIVSSRYDD